MMDGNDMPLRLRKAPSIRTNNTGRSFHLCFTDGNPGTPNKSTREGRMRMRINRRRFLRGAAVAATTPFLPAAPAIAEAPPVRIGLLTVKTGPLAQGGIQMEQGITVFLKQKNYTLAGRKIELTVADTGGSPAGAKTKAQEVVERDHVDFILGPLAAFELLAISDYVASAKVPILSL